MKRLIPAALLGLISGLLRVSFFAALPAPFAVIDPIIFLIIWYVADYAPDKALAAAIIAGASIDALSALPFASNTLAYAAACAVAILLYNRIFTSHDWPGILVMSLAAYSSILAVLLLLRAASAVLGGEVFFEMTITEYAPQFFSNLLTHSLVTIAVLFAFSILRRGHHRNSSIR